MKKLVLSVALLIGMTYGATAQYLIDVEGTPRPGGGLLGFGEVCDETDFSAGLWGDQLPLLPPSHNLDENQDASIPYTPVGSGTVLLLCMASMYAASKRNNR